MSMIESVAQVTPPPAAPALGGCLGWAGKIFGHKFEPRYVTDEEPVNTVPPAEVVLAAIRQSPSDTSINEVVASVGDAYRDVKTKQSYIADICPRCGQVLKVQ
jgi:hypothetical protein